MMYPSRSYGHMLRLLVVGSVLLSCQSPTAAPPEPAGAFRILFIGNSLTYTHDMPAVVEAMAASQGGPPVVARAVVGGNRSLEDHWYARTALRALHEDGPWDAVVMQQGPSSLPANQQHLATWASRFAEEARQAGARPALYMVWPGASRHHAFSAVVTAYTEAARQAQAALLPVGTAFLAGWDLDADLPLYGPDGFHPSPQGAYLAALVIYSGLTEADPAAIPDQIRHPDGRTFQVDAARAATLRAAAQAALALR
ncbi:MAG: hypothetical protein AAGI71_13285 [Bacteroidota bacterium]